MIAYDQLDTSPKTFFTKLVKLMVKKNGSEWNSVRLYKWDLKFFLVLVDVVHYSLYEDLNSSADWPGRRLCVFTVQNTDAGASPK